MSLFSIPSTLCLRFRNRCHLPSRVANFCRSASTTKSSLYKKDNSLDRMKLLIDTDPGTDDCHALTHLLKLGNVIAITSVFGNVKQPQTAQNACRILDMLGMNHIPVYNGAHCSLQKVFHLENVYCHGVHGSDGMNDVPDVVPVTVEKQPELDKTSPDAIIDIVKANPGEITLVALGPLTNVAIATRLCPELPKLVKSLYIMGSSSKVGNVTPWAEFNFHCDPLAAHVTLQHFCSLSMVHVVPWEPCLENCITFKQWDSLFEGSDGSPAKTLIQATGMTKWLRSRKKEDKEGYVFADQFISMILVYPESVIESDYYDTMTVNYDEKDEKFGLAEYKREDCSEKKECGLLVYTKFDMNYMMKIYTNSMKH
ncbi:uncharacterized protein LOC134820765 [Bolinopsis microptera]|uniref:uncharacterized protein LOC134820765 n=1 Tax=Bolinopsis microptera TaxID=2820187 RepID=UPI0030793015